MRIRRFPGRLRRLPLKQSSTKYVFITGTLLLTVAGVLTRIIGFFYRIFLSRTIGAEALGIYQLIAPVTALGFAITAAGIQTSVSKYVSAEMGRKNPAGANLYLAIGLFLSLILSTLTGLFIHQNAAFLSHAWLGDPAVSHCFRCFPSPLFHAASTRVSTAIIMG